MNGYILFSISTYAQNSSTKPKVASFIRFSCQSLPCWFFKYQNDHWCSRGCISSICLFIRIKGIVVSLVSDADASGLDSFFSSKLVILVGLIAFNWICSARTEKAEVSWVTLFVLGLQWSLIWIIFSLMSSSNSWITWLVGSGRRLVIIESSFLWRRMSSLFEQLISTPTSDGWIDRRRRRRRNQIFTFTPTHTSNRFAWIIAGFERAPTFNGKGTPPEGFFWNNFQRKSKFCTNLPQKPLRQTVLHYCVDGLLGRNHFIGYLLVCLVGFSEFGLGRAVMYRFYFNCHAWQPTRDEWLFGSRCIPTVQLERIERFVFERDAKLAFVGQLLSRYVLAQAFQRPSSSFLIRRTERGRPYVETEPTFDFNYSHHHHLVCLAGTFDGRIGCDTMEYQTKERRRESIESTTNLLRGEFSKDEYDFILKNTSDEAGRVRHFHRLWSLKESYVKWSGDGIHSSLSKLDFRVRTAEFDENNQEQILSDTILHEDGNPIDPQLRFDEQIIYLPNQEEQIVTLCLPRANPCQPFVELTMEQILLSCTPLDEHPHEEGKWWISLQSKKVK